MAGRLRRLYLEVWEERPTWLASEFARHETERIEWLPYRMRR
jgi:hypothetical protein